MSTPMNTEELFETVFDIASKKSVPEVVDATADALDRIGRAGQAWRLREARGDGDRALAVLAEIEAEIRSEEVNNATL